MVKKVIREVERQGGHQVTLKNKNLGVGSKKGIVTFLSIDEGKVLY